MKRITSKPAAVYLTCLLLLCGLSQQVIAWPCYPPCTGCCKCVNGSCVNGSCSGCCKCESCTCKDKDYKCNQANCEECKGCDCESKCDPDCEFCCDGTCCDEANCEICKNGSCVRAIPTNMSQTDCNDLGGGVLWFKYAWDSTTGDLNDLSSCSVREKVDYPGGNPYCFPSPPWDGCVTNPTILPNPPIPGTYGALQDTHSPPPFKKPYVAAYFSATQVYQYHCGPACCMADGEYVTLLGIGSIQRFVIDEGVCFRYSILKSGAYAEILPLP